MLTTAIEDTLAPTVVHCSSISGGGVGDFGESEQPLLVEKGLLVCAGGDLGDV